MNNEDIGLIGVLCFSSYSSDNVRGVIWDNTVVTLNANDESIENNDIGIIEVLLNDTSTYNESIGLNNNKSNKDLVTEEE